MQGRGRPLINKQLFAKTEENQKLQVKFKTIVHRSNLTTNETGW